jgi:proline dehydrogenase
MCDSISYTLSAYGIPVFKYLPFGEIEQVMPYLIRRAQENAAILDRTTTEREIIKDELKYRLLGTHSSGEKTTGLI